MANVNGNNGNVQAKPSVDEEKYAIKCFSKPVDGGIVKTCQINPLLLKALGIEIEFVEMPKQTAAPAKEVLTEETITLPPPE